MILLIIHVDDTIIIMIETTILSYLSYNISHVSFLVLFIFIILKLETCKAIVALLLSARVCVFFFLPVYSEPPVNSPLCQLEPPVNSDPDDRNNEATNTPSFRRFFESTAWSWTSGEFCSSAASAPPPFIW